MKDEVVMLANHATGAQIAEHLQACDGSFVPPLSSRVAIADYAARLFQKAVRFEAWHGKQPIGLVALYCNDPDRRVAFVTNVSVSPLWRGHGLAAALLDRGLRHAKEQGFARLELKVDRRNAAAVRLYEKQGFQADETSGRSLKMHLDLEGFRP